MAQLHEQQRRSNGSDGVRHAHGAALGGAGSSHVGRQSRALQRGQGSPTPRTSSKSVRGSRVQHLLAEEKITLRNNHYLSTRYSSVCAQCAVYRNMGFTPHASPWAISFMFPILSAQLSHQEPQETRSDFQTAPAGNATPEALLPAQAAP